MTIAIKRYLRPLLVLTAVGLSSARTADAAEISSVGRLATTRGSGSCVLVKRFGKRKQWALALTAAHVERQMPKGSSAFFVDARRNRVDGTLVRSIARNIRKDYALVLVRLPKRSQLQVADTSYSAGRGKVFAVGFPDHRPIIARGKVLRSGRTSTVELVDGRRVQAAQEFNYKSAPGFSGGGIFSAKTGKLVGVHWGNSAKNGGRCSFGVSLSTIKGDLAHRLPKSDAPNNIKKAVDDWLIPAPRGSVSSMAGGR